MPVQPIAKSMVIQKRQVVQGDPLGPHPDHVPHDLQHADLLDQLVHHGRRSLPERAVRKLAHRGLPFCSLSGPEGSAIGIPAAGWGRNELAS